MYIGSKNKCGFCLFRFTQYLNDLIKCPNCNAKLEQIDTLTLPANYKTIIPKAILEEYINMSSTNKVYNIRIQSPFILTPNKVKESLGIGYKVLEVNVEKESAPEPITNIDSAVSNIIKAGYRALAMSHHPDLGGDTNTMVILNKAKKELIELLESVKI